MYAAAEEEALRQAGGGGGSGGGGGEGGEGRRHSRRSRGRQRTRRDGRAALSDAMAWTPAMRRLFSLVEAC